MKTGYKNISINNQDVKVLVTPLLYIFSLNILGLKVNVAFHHDMDRGGFVCDTRGSKVGTWSWTGKYDTSFRNLKTKKIYTRSNKYWQEANRQILDCVSSISILQYNEKMDEMEKEAV